MEHAAVVPGLVPCDPVLLVDQRDPQVRPALEQPQRGREADDPGADDDDVGPGGVRHVAGPRRATCPGPMSDTHRRPEQRHRPLDLVAQDGERLGDARLTGARQRVQERPGREHRGGAEGECDQDLGPPPHTAVEIDLRAAVHGTHDLVQHLDRRRGPVELAAAVVRHPDAVGTVLDGQHGVLGRQDALEHERERRPRSHLGEVVPGEADAPHVEVVVHVGTGLPILPLGKVGVGMLARVERDPEHLVAVPEHREVHRQADRLVAGALGPADELATRRAIALHVQLEPAPATWRGVGDVLDRVGRRGRDNVDRPGRRCRPGRRLLTLRVGHAVERGGCHADRERRGTTEDDRGWIDGADVDEHARPKDEPVPGLDARAQRVLVAGAARVVRPGSRVDPVARRDLEVREADDRIQVDRRVGGRRVGQRGLGAAGHARG